MTLGQETTGAYSTNPKHYTGR